MYVNEETRVLRRLSYLLQHPGEPVTPDDVYEFSDFPEIHQKIYSSRPLSNVYYSEGDKRDVFSRRKYSKHSNDTGYHPTTPLPQVKQDASTPIIELATHHPDAVLTYFGDLDVIRHLPDNPYSFLAAPVPIAVCSQCGLQGRNFSCPRKEQCTR